MTCNQDLPERKGVITFQGSPLTLVGPELKPGDDATDCALLKNDLSEMKLSSLKGKRVLMASVPSLDTGVCDLETKRFNEEAGKLDNVEVLTISMDLPFAQGRWCGNNDAANLTTLSDHRDACFGVHYGVLIKELRLLARSVFVVGEDGNIKYVQIVPEMTDHPDYDAALEAARS